MQYTHLTAFNDKGAPGACRIYPESHRPSSLVQAGSNLLFSLPAMLWPSASQWWQLIPMKPVISLIARAEGTFSVSPWCTFKGLLSVSQVGTVLEYIFLSSVSFFPSYGSDFFPVLFIDGCTGESPTPLAHICQGRGNCIRTLPGIVLVVWHLVNLGRVCLFLCPSYCCYAWVGKASSGWEGRSIAALPVMKRTLGFDLRLVSGDCVAIG